MARAVIDASALLPVFVNAQTSLAARENYLAFDLIAPGLIVSECANALWKYVRSGEMDGALALGAYQAMFTQITMTPETELGVEPLELAMKYNHPAYDCFYLALSERENVPLITGDKRLIGKIETLSRFEIINIHDAI